MACTPYFTETFVFHTIMADYGEACDVHFLLVPWDSGAVLGADAQ